MSRQAPTPSAIKRLFAKSGNVCAFPGCAHELVADDGLYIAEMCHIEAAEPRGPRYNPNSSDEERRSHENFILLCHAHHRRIDSDVSTYAVERLCRMKAEHESVVLEGVFQADASVVSQVEREMESYWSALARRQEDHPVPDLAVEIESAASGTAVFQDLFTQLKRVEELLEHYRFSDERLPEDLEQLLLRIGYDLTPLKSVSYYENPFVQRNWEDHNLGSPNVLLDLNKLLFHAELLYLAEYSKLHTINDTAKARMEEIKSELLEIAGSAGYCD